jgi:hypothetical protein
MRLLWGSKRRITPFVWGSNREFGRAKIACLRLHEENASSKRHGGVWHPRRKARF